MSQRILFVDDERRVLAGLRRMLGWACGSWSMSFVESGAAALEELAREPYDVVISDMRMPAMDGAELLTIVRARYPHVVRIILSGHSDKEMILRSVGPAHQYLAKPCDPEQLRKTVERALALRSLLHSDELQEIIAGTDALPSLPEAFVQLQAELASSEATVETIGRIIERDVGMTSKILQLVNSAFFGLTRHIATPRDAVALLGIDTISALVLSLHIFHSFAQPAPELNLQHLAVHQLDVARLARAICRAERSDAKVADHAFLAGMLHDAGKLILADRFADRHRTVLEKAAKERIPLYKAETELLGTSHAEMGAFLLGIWGLPDPIVEAVAYHHFPSRSIGDRFSPLTAVHVANVFADAASADQAALEIDSGYLDRIGLTERLQVWRQVQEAGAAKVRHE